MNWNPIEFLKGRKKLLITIIGGIAGYLTTHNPIYTGIIATGTELVYSVIEFYFKDSSKD